MKAFKWGHNTKEPVALKNATAPTLRLDNKGQVVEIGPGGDVLVDLIQSNNLQIDNLIAQSLKTHSIMDERIKPTGSSQTFWLVTVPEDEDILLVARDFTVQDKVTEALMASRNMFRDMLGDAVEFGYEVDSLGRFIYIGPDNVFGTKADTLLGQKAQDLFWDIGKSPSRNPFKMRTAFETKPIKVTVGNSEHWMKFKGKPLTNGEGKFAGVRGVAFNVTKDVTEQKEYKQQALRLSLVTQITRVIQQARGSGELLQNAAQVMCNVFRADYCWAILEEASGCEVLPMNADQQEELILEDFSVALANEHHDFLAAWELQVGPDNLLVTRLMHGDKNQGLYVLKRNTEIFPWSHEEKALLDAVSGSLTVALEQAKLIDKLHQLSYRDELTGLMNRRAFNEEMDNRLKNQLRSGEAGTLMYVDLDNFKQVNDSLGHEYGDKALVHIAAVLKDNVRVRDMVGRIGGDEFLVWLEGSDAKAAQDKADKMLEAMPAVREALGDATLGLSLSIGIVQSTIEPPVSLKALMMCADRAMYGAKMAGKSGWVIAELDDDCD